MTIPTSLAEYIHRVGRTARLDSQGQALLFVMPEEAKFLELLSVHRIDISEIPVDKIIQTLMSTMHRSGTGSEEASRLQGHFERAVQEDTSLLLAARKAYMSFVRAYTSYPIPMRPIIRVKQLHLGHLAKSFALRDAPQEISKHVRESKMSKPDRPIKQTKVCWAMMIPTRNDGSDSPQMSKTEHSRMLVVDEFMGERGAAPKRKKGAKSE